MKNMSSGKSRILIVDDVPENIHLLIELLKEEYATLPAKSGAAALKKAMSEPRPDLILLDIMMPGLDGYEVCRILKEDEKTKEIPVIFITAVSEEIDAARAFEVGGVDYITKPFNPATVQARIRTHLRLNATLRELQKSLSEIKTLSGLIPICASCKKIRDDGGYWNQIELYIRDHSEVEFSHGICPQCAEDLYPKFKKRDRESTSADK